MTRHVSSVISSLSVLARVKGREKFFIVLLLLFSFALGIGLSVGYERLKIANRVAALFAGKVSGPLPEPALVTLETQTRTVKNGEPFTVDILLDSLLQDVHAAEFALTFDPAVITAVKITPGNYFVTYPVQDILDSTVNISATAGIRDKTLVVPKGKGIVATVEFRAHGVGQTAIGFEKDHTIIASAGKNILNAGSAQPITITVE